MIFMWGPFLGILLAVAGIIFAKFGMDQVDDNPQLYTGRNLGLAGLILSIAGGSLSLLLHAFLWTRIWWWG